MADLTTVDICNLALDRIGGKELRGISDLTVSDTSSEELRACARSYNIALEEILSKVDWNEASAYADLTPATPPVGAMSRWSNAYNLPSDCLLLREVLNSTEGGDYERVGRMILTNLDSLQIRYTKKLTDITQWSVMLRECVVVKLAIKLCKKLGASRTLQEQLLQELEYMLYEVRGIDVTAQTSQPLPDPATDLERG